MNHHMKNKPVPKMPKRETEALLEELREMLSIAKMERASFGWGDEKDPTEMIKETTRLYRESYLIYPLSELIKRYESALSAG